MEDSSQIDAERDRQRRAWRPRAMPGIGVELSPTQKMACAFRILARLDFSENLAGHITWAPDASGDMWVNPWGLWWSEVSASDVCRVNTDGEVLEGRWDVTPAIHLHTELHRRRPDARVVVHNHPYYVTVLAGLGLLPEILHQTGCMYADDLAFINEYNGEIDDAQLGADLAVSIGEASVVVLANHGVVVTGSTVEEAVYRAANFERVCRLDFETRLLAADPLHIPHEVQKALKTTLLERAPEIYWAGSVRQLLRHEPDVLD